MSWEFHVANALFLVSYAVKEILWVRLVLCLATIALIGALAVQDPAPGWFAFAWQGVFLAINAARLAQLIHERRAVPLPPDARRLATSVFASQRPRPLLRLLDVGEIVEHAEGARVVHQGESLAHLAVVLDGTAQVELAGARVAELGHGAFIGELSYLTGKPPAADLIAATKLRVVRWPCDALRGHLDGNPDTRTAMQLVLGSDLAAKLRGR